MAIATNNDIAKAIYLASKENPVNVVTETVRFFARKRLMSRAPDILARLEKIVHKAENKIRAKVTSAEQLGQTEKSNIEHFLKKRYEVTGILFEEVVDKKVVGGVKIEIDDEVLDLTVKNRIHKLQEYLIS